MKEMSSTNKTFLIGFLTALLLISSYSFGERDVASMSISEASERIEELKKDLERVKGQKRSKIVKKIAELENKVLEKTLRAASSQSR